MNDIGARLSADDPLRHDPAMSPQEIETMRRAVVAAADRRSEPLSWFPPLIALVATAAALVIAVVGARMRETRDAARVRSSSAQSDALPAATSGRRQLQFATPGGTRVIWVFDPEFNP